MCTYKGCSIQSIKNNIKDKSTKNIICINITWKGFISFQKVYLRFFTKSIIKVHFIYIKCKWRFLIWNRDFYKDFGWMILKYYCLNAFFCSFLQRVLIFYTFFCKCRIWTIKSKPLLYLKINLNKGFWSFISEYR